MKIFKMNTFSPKSLKTSPLKSEIPIVKKPILAYMEELRLHKYQQTETKNKGFFSGLKEALTSVVDTVPSVKFYKEIQVLKQQVIQEQEEKAAKAAQELFDLRNQFNELNIEYEQMFGLRLEKLPILTTPQVITEKITLMNARISRERMLQSLESTYTKGADYFCPNYISIIKHFSLNPLSPNKNNEYKSELKNLCNTYLANSTGIEPAFKEFNGITKNYFKHAGACLSEIFDLKKNIYSRIAERLPLVGVIPKAIRVDEQVRLSKCVLSDFKDVSETFVQKGIINIFNKYTEQYNTIKQFIEDSKQRADYNEEYTKKWMDKITEALKLRRDISTKMLNIYGKCGYNLVESCEKVKKDGSKEMAIKTISSLVSCGMF